MSEDRTPLEWALDYAARGWRVIPIPPGEKYPSEFKQWQKRATTDVEQITKWWSGRRAKHGIGIVTGIESNLFVVDVDVADGKPGLANWQALVELHGDAPTYTVRTGSGGLHFYYLMPDGVEVRNSAGNRLGEGIDVRGEGGFVVAPPTIHPNGTAYSVIDPTTVKDHA